MADTTPPPVDPVDRIICQTFGGHRVLDANPDHCITCGYDFPANTPNITRPIDFWPVFE